LLSVIKNNSSINRTICQLKFEQTGNKPGTESNRGTSPIFGDDEIMMTQIRGYISTGRPVGDKGFEVRVEGLLGRILMAKPMGRPKKIQ